jgi:hypothetical protein
LKRYNLYFFAGYEGLRQPDTESSGLRTVPTAAERAGDFSQTFNSDGSPTIIYNPFSTRLVTDAEGNTYYTRDPFPGNQVPSQLFKSVGQNILKLYPEPNRPPQGPNQINNYFAQGHGTTDNDKFDWRVDWNQNAIHRIFVRMSDRVAPKLHAPVLLVQWSGSGSGQRRSRLPGGAERYDHAEPYLGHQHLRGLQQVV